MFLERRVYQGSSGAVYPYPVVERVADEKRDRSYQAVCLENRYVKVMILPELGGQVQMALDKTNGYDFVYHNRVVKPALVGLAGPWISGGIEFNWPQHHRPSTFLPVAWRIDENADGSKTVWCSEIERMFDTKGTHGVTLYPDRAYVLIDVRLYNRTDRTQSFLWWANPAVHVDDEFQSVFPPDVHAVFDHGKRAVSSFPIATGTYYNVDFAPGTDISRYRNIPVPMSYMASHSDFDFVGCWDEGRRAGMVHVANHHVVPGKKQWTWGSGDFGRAWDRELTDEDGPYAELMCGAYSDNQPDFSWIRPGEEKRFTQVFMPYKLIGPAKNASRDAVVNLELGEGEATIGIYVSRPCTVTVGLRHLSETLFEATRALSPETALVENVPLPAGLRAEELTLEALEEGRILVWFTPPPDEERPLPAPATAARPPAEIESNEELFLTGLHLEQYRHASYAPEPYYEEALRRDPMDSRCNNVLGLALYRRGKFAEAEPFFRRAIDRLTARNPNPSEGEPFHNLGLALKMQGRTREAFDAFYKAFWSGSWRDAAGFELARLACADGRLDAGLELTAECLERNRSHHQARHLRMAILRRLGRREEALGEADLALRLDPMELGAMWEKGLLTGAGRFERHARDAHDHIAISLDYAQAGLWDDAIDLLRRAPLSDPMVKYYLGWFRARAGDEEGARRELQEAAALPPDYCFPNRLESVLALEAAMRLHPADARAPYYLGNFWYAHRRYGKAVKCWERARTLDGSFPTVHRNLGLAYYNKLRDPGRALEEYERAFALDPTDARVFYELDQLRKRLNVPPEERLARLDAHPELVSRRDDLTLEKISLLNCLGRPEEALDVLMGRRFHPWEGGEGKATGQYVVSLIEIARELIGRSEFGRAVECLERARVYPPNLGEGKLYGTPENHVLYYLGLALEGLGHNERALRCFEEAAVGQSGTELLFYQGLALLRLGRADEARALFESLVEYGRSHLEDDVPVDYFAVSVADFLVFDEDGRLRNQIHCHYLTALGWLGLGAGEEATSCFDWVLERDAGHLGAALYRRLL